MPFVCRVQGRLRARCKADRRRMNCAGEIFLCSWSERTANHDEEETTVPYAPISRRKRQSRSKRGTDQPPALLS